MDTDALRRQPRRAPARTPARFLTISCFLQRPYLTTDWARLSTSRALALACDTHDVTLCAWVIMPEHVHLLILPRCPKDPVPRFLTTLKQHATRQAAEWAGARAPAYLRHMTHTTSSGRTARRFWQPGAAVDRTVPLSDAFLSAIRRIHENPVRRGLVDRPEEWDWSSARDARHPWASLFRINVLTEHRLAN